MIVINTKAYKEGVGRKGVSLASVVKSVSSLYTVPVILAVQAQDIAAVASTGIRTFAQHIDPVPFGSFTGHMLCEGVREAGARGTLLNHAEKRLSWAVLRETVARAKKCGLDTVVCAQTIREAKRIARLKPYAIAIEPPELIGGTISVTEAKPNLIKNTAARIKNVPILCGAGIHNGEDVRAALKLGAQGVLVAHAVVQAKNPKKVLVEMAQAFTQEM